MVGDRHNKMNKQKYNIGIKIITFIPVSLILLQLLYR